MANFCPCTFGNSVSQALNHLRKARKLQEVTVEETFRATVVSRRVDTCYSLEKTDSSWGYFITFRMEDETETELRTTEEDFQNLKEGTSLSLTRQADHLVCYTIEME